MGKKRSNRASSLSSSKSGGNSHGNPHASASAGTSSSSSSSNHGSMPGSLLGSGGAPPRINSIYTHPMGVPLNAAVTPNTMPGGMPGGYANHNNPNNNNNNNHQTSSQSNNQPNPNNYPFTPAMIRELLSSCPPASSYSAAMTPGYNRLIPPATTAADLNRLTNMANASTANAAANAGRGGNHGAGGRGGNGGGRGVGTGGRGNNHHVVVGGGGGPTMGHARNTAAAGASSNPGVGGGTASIGNMSQEDALAAQRYLQSISEALASQLTASANNPNGNNNNNNGSNSNASNNNPNMKVFGPIPPPPNAKGGVSGGVSISSMGGGTINVGMGMGNPAMSGGGVNGGSAQFDLDASCGASVQSLGFQLEALSAIMQGQQQQQQQQGPPQGGSSRGGGAMGGKRGGANLNNADNNRDAIPNVDKSQQPPQAMALDALEKMGQATVDHMANFQQLLNVIANQSANQAASMQGTPAHASFEAGVNMAKNGAFGGVGGVAGNASRRGGNSKNTNNNNNNNNNPNPNNEDLQSMLPIFSELVTLTNSIVSAQEAGDTARVDAVTTQLCERVMKDSQAMGVLSVAMQNPVGMAGMNAVFQGMMMMEDEDNGNGGGGGGGGGGKYKGNLSAEEVEALKKAAFGAANPTGGGASATAPQGHSNQERLQRQHPQQSQQQQNGGKNKGPVFSMIFGGSNSGNGANASVPPNIPPGASVPPLPPPPGGWPPGAAPAAASAAAMAAFASSFNGDNSPPGGYPNPNGGNAANPSDFPMGSGGVDGPEFGSAAWLDYYDACLRAGGVKGGIAEFEQFALMSGGGQGAPVMPPGVMEQMAGGMGHHGGMPQDRPMPRMGGNKGGGDADRLPAGFEYDDGGQFAADEDDEYEDQLTEQQIEELEQRLVIEEEEKKKKKAAKKRDKKARQKERAKKEAEAKAQAAATKRREKAIASWRSRVVAACGNGDRKKMDTLVGESPYKNYVYDPSSVLDDDNEADEDRPQSQEEYLVKQLDWFLPNCLQKYSQNQLSESAQPFANNHARERFAKYIMSTSFNVILLQSPVKSRNAIHSAAYYNDVNFLKWVIEKSPQKDTTQNIMESYCIDGGWAPLHYATAGGCQEAVELLLNHGCGVQTRTDRSLTCFNRYGRRGNGITARELAIVLQSGAVDDDLTSDSDILDEIVENRIEDANTNDKAAYMRILKSLEERFYQIEQYGYRPPSKTTSVEQQQGEDVDLDNGVHTTATPSNTNNKKSKKKKKKQQQSNAKGPAPAATISSEPEPKSAAPSASTDDDLTDPVAVALLGMGFTGDQIKSAASALGGFERATADDMVMWILGGGEIPADEAHVDQGNQEEQTNDDDDDDDDDYTTTKNSSDPGSGQVLTKSQKKAAARAKRDAEESARKHQSELAAANRASKKREEQRRIRREWNEREQLRQQEERNAKVQDAIERKKRKDLEKQQGVGGMMLPPTKGVLNVVPPVVGGAPSPAVHVPVGGSGKHHHHHGGPPLTIIAGGPKMPSKSNKNTAPGSNMGIPKAPTVRAPKILTRPKNNAPQPNPPALPGGAAAVGVHHLEQSAVLAGNQPLFTPLAGGKPASSPPPRGNAKSYHNQSPAHHHHPPQPSHHHHQPHPPMAILQKNNLAAAGPPSRGRKPWIPPTEYRHHHNTRGGHHAASGSFAHVSNNNGMYKNNERPGGGTHLYQNQVSQGSSGNGSVPPPGFRPGGVGPPEPPSTNNEPDSSAPFVDTNPMGMIRATAREFVPTSFSPAPVSTPESNHAVSSMSAQSMSAQPTTGLSAQLTSTPPPTRSRSASTDHEAVNQILAEPMSNLLSSFGADTSNTPPATTVVGNIEDSTVPSAASSITGLSGLPNAATAAEEGHAASRVGSVMTFESTSSSINGGGVGRAGTGVLVQPMRTSSILESISYGAGDQNSATDIGSAALGAGGIWGGGNNVNQTASLGLAGLNFSSFMGEQQNNDEGNNAGNNSTTWGTSTGGAGGSIW